MEEGCKPKAKSGCILSAYISKDFDGCQQNSYKTQKQNLQTVVRKCLQIVKMSANRKNIIDNELWK